MHQTTDDEHAPEALFEKRPFSLVNALKGMGVGMANIIPGVSGGTIAVITGIYDELVDAFGNFFSSEGGWRRNLFFLTPVILGILLGNIALARLIGILLEEVPGPTNFAFIGLILGSTPYLVKRMGARTVRLRHGLLFVVGVVVVLWMGLTSPPAASQPIIELTITSAAYVFGAAFLASIAMIIPGVSGSFLLLLIGMYSTLQNAFSTLNLAIIGLFAAGTLVGVVIVSKGISALLRNFHGSTYAVVMGLVIGSSITLFPGFGSGAMILADILAFALGAGLSIILGTDVKERLISRRETT